MPERQANSEGAKGRSWLAPPVPKPESGDSARRRRWTTALMTLLLIDGLKHVVLMAPGQPPLVFDAWQYWQLSGDMLAGDLLLADSGLAFRTPGYPMFLSAMRSAFGEHGWWAAVAAQHLLVIATSLLIALTCGMLTRRASLALVGYALSMLGLTRAGYANLLLSESLFTFLLTSHVAAALWHLKQPTLSRATLVGLLLGATTLVRPITMYLWIPVTVMMAAAIWQQGQSDRYRRMATHALVVFVLLSAWMVPWMLRNNQLFGEMVYTRFLGRNLWLICFPQDPSQGLKPPDTPARARLYALTDELEVDYRNTWSVSDALRQAGLDDAKTDVLMAQVSQDAIVAQPLRYLRQTAQRFLGYWYSASEAPGIVEPLHAPPPQPIDQRRLRIAGLKEPAELLARYAPSQSRRLNLLFSLLSWAGVAGLVALPKTRMAGLILASVILYFATVTVAVEMPDYRFRLVIEPLMIIGGCSGAWAWWQRVRI